MLVALGLSTEIVETDLTSFTIVEIVLFAIQTPTMLAPHT
jgi:hypothetical protein